MGAKVYGNPVGQEGWSPQITFVDAREEIFDSIITPGFINSLVASGNNIPLQNMLLIQYNVATELFVQTKTDGIVTLNVYSPNDTSFQFTNLQFVAKGGSDLNAGNSMGRPKLTIQAAYDVVKMGPDQNGLVWILDSGAYTENLNLTTTKNVFLYGPNATFDCASGDLITLNDTGANYIVKINCAGISNNGSGKLFNVLGSNSVCLTDLYLALQGDIYCEGALSLQGLFLAASNITVTATAQVNVNVLNSFGVTLNNSGRFVGDLGNIGGASQMYGSRVFNDKTVFQQDEKQETVGRTLAVEDGISTIQFNSVTDDIYTLPQTSDVPILIGTVVTFIQMGAGKVTFVAGSGVTLVNVLLGPCRTNAMFAKAFAEKLTDTVWHVYGEIEATP